MIVLGGSTVTDDLMSEGSYWRSIYAIQAYREGGVQHLILAGDGNPRWPVAQLMKTFLECHGVPAEVIELEVESTSTRENALYVKPLIADKLGRKILLTSDYHMFRAYRSFKKVGIDVEPRPFPDAIKRAASFQSRWSAFVDVARESVAIVYYYSRGWI